MADQSAYERLVGPLSDAAEILISNYLSRHPQKVPASAWTQAAKNLEPMPIDAAELSEAIPGAGPVVGSLKKGVPFAALQRAMAGQNPLDLSRKELGKFIQNLGPDIRTKASELMGAQAIDELKTIKPEEIIRRHLLQAGLPKEKLPQVGFENIGSSFGSYHPVDNKILLNLEAHPQGVQHSTENLLGTARHEAIHAEDALKNPNTISMPETGLVAPRTNASLGWQGAFEPHRVEEYIRAVKEDPKLKAPFWVHEALAKGHSPKDIAQYAARDESFRSVMAGQIRTAGGNRGFRGTDPNLVASLQSAKHFEKFKNELEIPPYYLGKQQASLGGDIHPDWLKRFPELEEMQYGYKAPIRPWETSGKEKALESVKAAANPWSFALGGLGGAGAGYYLHDKDKDRVAPKSAEKEQDKMDTLLFHLFSPMQPKY